MRADRLISLIMLLETRGPLTAKELADELEVSQRTIYRDIEAISIAGIPVFGSPGPEGGYRLVEGYRSYLNDLNKDEISALLSLNISEHFNHLEIGSKLKGALLKLRSSYLHISNHESNQETNLADKLYIDPTGWDHQKENIQNRSKSLSHFNTIYRAIQRNQKLTITYSQPIYSSYTFEKIVEPYGLVTKENTWHLIYFSQEKIRVLEISNIIELEERDEYFTYPTDFHLKTFWEKWCSQVGEQYTSFHVKALVPTKLSSSIATYLRKGKVPFSPIPANYSLEEWTEVDLFFESFEAARSKLLSFGCSVKVIEPLALRYSILDYVEQIQSIYK